jgi:hypothetical protein
MQYSLTGEQHYATTLPPYLVEKFLGIFNAQVGDAGIEPATSAV